MDIEFLMVNYRVSWIVYDEKSKLMYCLMVRLMGNVNGSCSCEYFLSIENELLIIVCRGKSNYIL